MVNTRICRGWLSLWCVLAWTAGMALAQEANEPAGHSAARWWKGNLHTHSYWSDGDQMPEMVVGWYKEHGYHFLAMSEHDRPPMGDYWKAVGDVVNPDDAWQMVLPGILTHYQKAYGPRWVETRQHEGKTEVRLKPIGELAALFDEPGRFVVMPSQELWTLVEVAGKPFTPGNQGTAWINLANSYAAVPPAKSPVPREAMQGTITNMLEYAQKNGQRVWVSLNHPNYDWGCVAEDIAAVDGLGAMEFHTALSVCNSQGDELHAGAERIWDIVLTLRLGALGKGLIFGMASSDSHTYEALPNMRNWGRPGRAWLMVRAERLTPESIIEAMGRGDFYGSTGVTLREVTVSPEGLSLAIEGKSGVSYTTQFIGTLEGYDARAETVVDKEGRALRTTKRYSSDVGKVLLESGDLRPSYRFTGKELYVRAKVISSQKHPQPSWPGQVECAWTQPVRPGKR